MTRSGHRTVLEAAGDADPDDDKMGSVYVGVYMWYVCMWYICVYGQSMWYVYV